MIKVKQSNRQKHIYYIVFCLIILLSTILFVMYKYYVEGEQNLPFNVTKLMIVSSAETQNLELNDNIYQADIIQKNDLYIAIEKNENYKKEEAIKKVTINNFEFTIPTKVGETNIYRTANGEKLFNYKEEYMVNELVYEGSQETNLYDDSMTIANQGGLLKFSIATNNLGKITFEENDNVVSDGTLLQKLDLTEEDIKLEVTFDLIIELSSGKVFKTTVTINTPVGNIVSEGVATRELNNGLVFKR